MSKNNPLTPANPLMPHWLRLAQVPYYYGLGRSTVYSLIKRGLIKSVSVTKKNTVRGCRLISAQSIDHYLSTLQQKQEQKVK
jgi:hypothetical protein